MTTKELIDLLKRFDPQSVVRLCINLPGRVIQTHQTLWVADYGGGPQINASLDFRGFSVYVGCGLEQLVRTIPERKIDLGKYATAEEAAKVHDFYVVHEGLDEPLNYPDFDYQKWIPPRTVSGEYNPIIARILRDKLMRE
ncbi:MAG: hypothetical protein ACUVUC_12820 [Thermoguttaceae bacterium]